MMHGKTALKFISYNIYILSQIVEMTAPDSLQYTAFFVHLLFNNQSLSLPAMLTNVETSLQVL